MAMQSALRGAQVGGRVLLCSLSLTCDCGGTSRAPLLGLECFAPHRAQAVRNGPAVMPGAVAVEDELGRVISLANFTPEV